LECRSQISGGTRGGADIATSSLAEKSALPYNHPSLDRIALDTEEKYNLPPGLLLALKNAGERSSTLKPDGSMNVSPKGAKGVMQFIDSTRTEYPHDPLDPVQSIDAAGRFMADLLRQYGGNPMAALAHYNGGFRNGRSVATSGNAVSAETIKYLENVRSYMNSLQR
jgi:membrane-bound lytic murein transglycosylase MltF